MKVLLVSVTAGYGHHASAGAIEERLIERGHNVLTTDIFKQINTALYRVVDKGYALSTKYTPLQYGHAYRSMEKNDLLRRSVLAVLQSELLSDRFFDQINAFRPDAIICTHVFASQIIDDLLEHDAARAFHVGIVTDYTLHPFWETVRNIDYIALASELLRYRAVSRGIPSDKLLSLGIPVSSKFTQTLDCADARAILNIDKNRYTVLFMAGSMGFGNMLPSVKGIAESGLPVQILCVCGKNDKLASKLRREAFNVPVRVYGFVDNIDVMMSAADCVVTKPGGLTVTETLAKRKPLVLQTPIPGQEEENAEFLLNNGLAMRATDTMPAKEVVASLLANPKRVEMMINAIDAFISPDSSERLCDLLEEKVLSERLCIR